MSSSCTKIFLLTRRDPKKVDLIYKKKCIYSYMFKLSHLQSTLHLMQYTYRDVFSTAQNRFLNFSILMPFSTSVLFCFISSISVNISLWGLFSSGETKKSHSEWDQVNREGGAWGSCHFGWKTDRHSVPHGSMVWAGVLINHPSWNGQIHGKSLHKEFTEAKCSLSQQRQLVHWYRWVPRVLT